MSELLENKNNLNKQRCMDFTYEMKRIIDNQEYKNGQFRNIWVSQFIYSTYCDEFHKFVDNVNNNPKNKMFIEYNKDEPIVTHISTDVDIKNDKVTYKLSCQGEYCNWF